MLFSLEKGGLFCYFLSWKYPRDRNMEEFAPYILQAATTTMTSILRNLAYDA